MPVISGKPPLPEEDDEDVTVDVGDSDVVDTNEPADDVEPGSVDDEGTDDEYEPNDDL